LDFLKIYQKSTALLENFKMNKTIDLKKIQIYLINLEEDSEKRSRVFQWCETLGFLKPIIVQGIKKSKYWVGLDLAHARAISLGVKSKKPFIIMEDDAFPNYDDESYVVSIPNDTDALYLGGCRNGVDKENSFTHKTDGALFENVLGDSLTFRALNLLTTHAILYLNLKYALKAKHVCLKAATEEKHTDLAFAKNLLPNYKVYFIKPFFYQNDLKKPFMIEETRVVDPRRYIKMNK
jgi:hypothetical protein